MDGIPDMRCSVGICLLLAVGATSAAGQVVSSDTLLIQSPLEAPEIWEKRLIDEMPRLGDYLGSQGSIEEFNLALDRHRRRIESLNQSLLSYCKSLNELDADIRLGRMGADVLDDYEEIRGRILVEKRECDSNNKVGQYWPIYDYAIALYSNRIEQYRSEISKCRSTGVCSG